MRSQYMDDFVKELKTAGSFLDVVAAGGFDFNFGPLPVRFSILMKLASRLINHGRSCRRSCSRWTARQRGGARRPHSVPRVQAPPVAVRRVPRADGEPGQPPAWRSNGKR